MIAEIISFGGRWKDVTAIVRERRKSVRLAQESKSVLVTLKTKQRDTRETVNENGKAVKNERFGKFYYETAETIEVFDATPQEVKEAVLRGIAAATRK